MSFSQKVSKLLQENKMTKATLAKETGIPYTTLDSMLKRETDTRRLASVFRIARALGTSVEALVFDREEEQAVSEEEKRILELYSLLDARGRNTVLSILEHQVDCSKTPSPTIPVYEAPAAAGAGLPVYSDKAELLPLTEDAPQGADFGIRISGDSMEPLFSDGDLVYVEKTEQILSGQIGIFLLNGESLCKKYTVTEGEAYLVSLNPAYEPIHVLEGDSVRLVGRVISKETD